jgi:hypothetical protein
MDKQKVVLSEKSMADYLAKKLVERTVVKMVATLELLRVEW